MARQASVSFIALALVLASSHRPAAAQSPAGSTRGLVTGYARFGYDALPNDEFPNDFTAEISPTFLYLVGDDLLFEAETTFELEEAATTTHLEHAMVHYLGFERVQITAGMMMLPFGIWMHPAMVNKMPNPPLLYEDTHGAPAHEGLLPILFDVGVMATVNLPVADRWSTSGTVWVSQGPSDEIPEDHGDAEPEGPEPDAPRLGYGASFEDNNSDKMVGLMLRAVSPFGVTVQGSGFRAKYDAAGEFGVYGLNLSLQWYPGGHEQPLFMFRGEGILLGEEYFEAGTGRKSTANSGGYYIQVSRRLATFEPVVRWSQLPQSISGPGVLVEGRRRLALGLDYWFSPSVPLKAAYQVELDGQDSIFLEWAVGF